MTKFWSLYCRIRQGFRAKEGEDLRKDERLLKTDSKKAEELSAFFEIPTLWPDNQISVNAEDAPPSWYS